MRLISQIRWAVAALALLGGSALGQESKTLDEYFHTAWTIDDGEPASAQVMANGRWLPVVRNSHGALPIRWRSLRPLRIDAPRQISRFSLAHGVPRGIPVPTRSRPRRNTSAPVGGGFVADTLGAERLTTRPRT
jgi:hypothetical protein